jgi:uncharacterized surface protein with fasciclin (FAS1) repeats
LLENVLLSKRNRQRLKHLLSYHVIPDIRLVPDSIDGSIELTTLSGRVLPVVRSGLSLSVVSTSATAVVTRRIEVDDGVIFVVDRLLWPDWRTWPADHSPVAGQ